MSRYVSRKKYENLKVIASKWRDEYEKIKDKLVIVQDMEDQINNLRQENETLKNKITKHTPDTDLLDELENENKTFRKEIRSLKKENKELLEQVASM